ncbi:YwmB family TATA-box binding protein [Radiobacillus sp. PE A8.2]|uniref:YwmB family TATA-box binding protein n=1 Tax=Radiobacillus sp. PE A8.2 TaxID=3380349 RepID=UPI00388DAD1D
MILKLKNEFFVILTVITFVIVMLMNQNNTTFAASDGEDDGLLLMQTLSEANVDIERMVLKYSGLVKTYKDSIHIRSFKRQLEQAFSINLIQISKSNNKDLIKYQGKKVVSSLPNTTIQVALASVLKENGNYDVYLIASLVNNSNTEADFSKSFTYLKHSLEKTSIEPKIKINIQGSLDRKLSHNSQEQIIKEMFEDLEAPVTEGLNEKEVISLTGFSNKLSYSIKSHKNPVNVQIASRFDPLKNKTNFTIGTPLITIVY